MNGYGYYSDIDKVWYIDIVYFMDTVNYCYGFYTAIITIVVDVDMKERR